MGAREDIQSFLSGFNPVFFGEVERKKKVRDALELRRLQKQQDLDFRGLTKQQEL